MSAPFEFTWLGDNGHMDLSQTPVLCEQLDAWCTEQYGNEELVFGVLAFNDEMDLLGILIGAHGLPGADDPVHEEGHEWDATANWVKSLGSNHLMTFVRRAGEAAEAGARPSEWDVGMAEITLELARESELTYQGHIITTGTDHGVMPGALIDKHMHEQHSQPGIAQLMSMLDDDTKAQIGRAILDRSRERGVIDPTIIEAMELTIAKHEAGETDLDDEERALVQRALERIEEELNGGVEDDAPEPPRLGSGLNQPRPDVPSAFYN